MCDIVLVSGVQQSNYVLSLCICIFSPILFFIGCYSEYSFLYCIVSCKFPYTVNPFYLTILYMAMCIC